MEENLTADSGGSGSNFKYFVCTHSQIIFITDIYTSSAYCFVHAVHLKPPRQPAAIDTLQIYISTVYFLRIPHFLDNLTSYLRLGKKTNVHKQICAEGVRVTDGGVSGRTQQQKGHAPASSFCAERVCGAPPLTIELFLQVLHLHQRRAA